MKGPWRNLKHSAMKAVSVICLLPASAEFSTLSAIFDLLTVDEILLRNSSKKKQVDACMCIGKVKLRLVC